MSRIFVFTYGEIKRLGNIGGREGQGNPDARSGPFGRRGVPEDTEAEHGPAKDHERDRRSDHTDR